MTEETELDIPTTPVADNEDGDVITFDGFTSSNIQSPVGFSPSKRELYITFNSGQRWTYAGVDESLFEAMKAAPSVGKFFIANVRNAYSGTQNG